MVSKLDKLIKTYHSPECEFNIDKSIEICEEILNINPKLIEYQSHLAYSYYQKSEYTKTIQLFTDYIENGGEKDISYYMIALSYFKLNEMEKGFEYLERIEDEENYYMYHFRAYNELGEYDKAIEYGDMALEINPENSLVLHTMSNLYDEIGDEDRSIFYLDELSKLFPSVKSIEIIKLYSLERYDEVIEVFEENKNDGIFDGDLENDRFNCIIGNSYYELQKPYEALKYLLESDRLNEKIYKKITIAKLYMSIHEYDIAYKYLKYILEMEPLDEECLFMISKNCYFREKHIESVEWANKLLSNYPHNKIFHVLGAVLIELGDYEKAFEYIKLGTDLMIKNEDYDGEHILIMARELGKAGLYKRALNIYRHMLKGFPDYHYIYLERGKLHKRMGNKELAEKDFKTYNKLQREWEDKIDSMSSDYEFLFD